MPQPYRPLADGQGGTGRHSAVIGCLLPTHHGAHRASSGSYPGCPQGAFRHTGLPPCCILKGAISACSFHALRGGIPCHQNAPLWVLCIVAISHPQGVLRSRIITPSGWCTAMVLLYPAGSMLHSHGPPRLATHCRRIGSLRRHSGTSIH